MHTIYVTPCQQWSISLKKMSIHLLWDVWKLGRKSFCSRSGKPDDKRYTPQFFLRTPERGIRSPFIDQEIKHLLRADNVCAEDLLAAVMGSSTNEYEISTCNLRLLRKLQRYMKLAAMKTLRLSKMIPFQN